MIYSKMHAHEEGEEKELLSNRQLVLISGWFVLAYWFKFDKVFLTISILLFVWSNLGERRHGQFSAYNVFNRNFQRLLGDTSAEEIDAQLRNQIGRREKAVTDDKVSQKSFSSKEANQPCSCGSGRKVKKCCGAVSDEVKAENARRRQHEAQTQSIIDKYRF